MPREQGYRVGGVVHKAFFVAPVDANYSFNTRFNDGGELWLSPNADPRQAQRLISTDTPDMGVVSPDVDKWPSCADGYCFRHFSGYVKQSWAADVCAEYGGRLANPRSFATSWAIEDLGFTDSVWIGMTDEDKEQTFRFSDGTTAGRSIWDEDASAQYNEGWDANSPTGVGFENWQDSEPNDYGGTEDCTNMCDPTQRHAALALLRCIALHRTFLH
jgi:hypothetical protein